MITPETIVTRKDLQYSCRFKIAVNGFSTDNRLYISRRGLEPSDRILHATFVQQQRVYEQALRSTGLYTGVVYSSGAEGVALYVWDILQDYHSLQDCIKAMTPHSYMTSIIARQFRNEFKSFGRIRMSNVAPDRVDELIEVCEKKGIETEVVRFSA